MCADLNSTLTAAQTYRAAARTALAERLATRAIDAEQRAAHGFAWIATTVAALERSEEHTSELQSLMRISYAVFCLKKKTNQSPHQHKPPGKCGRADAQTQPKN